MSTSSERRVAWRVWTAVGLGTMALHGCVLDAVWPALPGADPGSRPLYVRTLPAASDLSPATVRSAAAIEVPKPAAIVPAQQVHRAHRPVTGDAPRGGLQSVSALVDVEAAVPPMRTVQAETLLVAAASDVPQQASGSAVTPAPALPDSVPTYRTDPPPATHLAYDLRHGMLSGQGEIDWAPNGPRYTLKLEGRIASLTLLTQISTGGFDTHGLAPERYTDQRMKRAANAANLQRGSGRITFSGPDTDYPLLPGTQDRVSWMVQLASIVNAQPELAKPGAKVTLFVVGARGEGDVWVFVCTGSETVDTGLGPMRADKFIREPTKPHDTQVEAWLAPRLHGLPAHARLSNGNDGALDLILRQAN